MLNMVIILIVMYCNVVTAIDKIPTYLLRFNKEWVRMRVGKARVERMRPVRVNKVRKGERTRDQGVRGGRGEGGEG